MECVRRNILQVLIYKNRKAQMLLVLFRASIYCAFGSDVEMLTAEVFI